MHNTHGTLTQLDTLGQNKATFFSPLKNERKKKKVINPFAMSVFQLEFFIFIKINLETNI